MPWFIEVPCLHSYKKVRLIICLHFVWYNTGQAQNNGAVSKLGFLWSRQSQQSFNGQQIYFSSYTGTTYTISNGNCPRFSYATSSSLLMLTAGPRDQFLRRRRSRRRLSVCPVLRCPDLWLHEELEHFRCCLCMLFSFRVKNTFFDNFWNRIILLCMLCTFFLKILAEVD
jgi:hypothetical protein